MNLFQARRKLRKLPQGSINVSIFTYNINHNTNGNLIASYTCYFLLDIEEHIYKFPICSSKKRQLIGSTGRNEAALDRLKTLGYKIKIPDYPTICDYEGIAFYKVENL